MALALRVSATAYNGTATATSLGGYAAATAPSATKAAFFESITSAVDDVGHTDYRCLFVVNTGTTVMNNVTVIASNKGGGSTVTVAASSVATGAAATYQTAVIANETTAPSVTGSYASSVNVGTLNSGQVKAVWLKRVTAAKAAASSGDTVTVVVSADEVRADPAP